MNPKTKDEIIAKFQLYMDDMTELSDSEESDLFDKKYSQINTARAWQYARKAGTGVIALASSVYSMALPSDFAYFTPNENHTGSDYDAEGPVVFIGTNYAPYKIVNFSDRRQYQGQTGVAYLDFANSRIVFQGTPTVGTAVEFDYQSFPVALTGTQYPIFPAAYHDAIYHAMCVDSFVIDQSDKAKSYASENQTMYDRYIDEMALWDANLIQM